MCITVHDVFRELIKSIIRSVPKWMSSRAPNVIDANVTSINNFNIFVDVPRSILKFKIVFSD
jgi:hypothetical protein